MRVVTGTEVAFVLLLIVGAGCRTLSGAPVARRPAWADVVELREADALWGFAYAAPGSWLAYELTGEVRLWRHRRGARAVWTRQGRRLVLNGRALGVDLTGLSGPMAARWLCDHRGWERWVVLQGDALTPAVVRCLRRARRLGLALVPTSGVPTDLTRLGPLADSLIALSLKEARLTRETTAAVLAGLGRLEALSLAGARLGPRSADRVLSPLRRLKSLRLLDLTDVPVRDLGFVSSLVGLRRLLLAGTRVVDDSLAGLEPLGGLGALDLSRTEISDFGVDRLTPMTSLRSVDLADTGVTDLGVDLVAGLGGLRVLRLGPNITDVGLAHLSDLSGLRVLALRRTAITGDGVARLGRLWRLQSLDLAWTDVGDAALVHLRPLVCLRHLDLGRTRVTGIGLGNLAQAHLLAVLVLRWTPLKERHLGALAGFRSLRQVDLTGTPWGRPPRDR